jgi:hypothetical protein
MYAMQNKQSTLPLIKTFVKKEIQNKLNKLQVLALTTQCWQNCNLKKANKSLEENQQF